eukprot:TRINITY_DN15892_c0_g1_i1.p2 TRINITY_DN15892_c0_g1~~TRINITY_DN15892_c0_g1_i1.p2  ORF type:complete len:152 (-),score=12.61 TRINITY_DN15892_c0_g1_i1:82-537(-)
MGCTMSDTTVPEDARNVGIGSNQTTTSNQNQSLPSKIGILRDQWGEYIPCQDTNPVPSFPCQTNKDCTKNNRLCHAHKYVIFVKTVTGETYEIPFGKWENFSWYKLRIKELTGIPVEKQRIIFAGADRADDQRHSGLQFQSTIHLVIRALS